jgi:hypothetical protein
MVAKHFPSNISSWNCFTATKRFQANIPGWNRLTVAKQFIPKLLVGNTFNGRGTFFPPIFLVRIPTNNHCGNRLATTKCFPTT